MKIFAAMLFLGLAAGLATGQIPTNRPAVRPSGFVPPPQASPEAEQMIELYAKLTGRTVLRPSYLTRMGGLPDGIDINETNKAVQLIEGEFAKAKYLPIRDGDKFIRLTPIGWDSPSNSPQASVLRNIGPVPATDSSGTNQVLAPGHIRFPQIDLNTFLDFYSRLSGRIVLRPPTVPQPTIRLIGQTQWTRAEAIYAFEMVLALNDIAVVHDGDDFAQVASVRDIATVQTNAPPHKPDEPRNNTVALPPGQKLDLWLTYYAKAKGKSAQVSNALGSTVIRSGLNGQMTRSEALYAIETILRFNGLVIVPVDDATISVAKVSGK